MSLTLLRMLADASIRVSLLAAIVAAILALLRVRANSVRHASWTAVSCATLLMPILPYCVPPIALPVAVPFSAASSATGRVSLEPVADDEAVRAATTGRVAPMPHAVATSPEQPVHVSSATPGERASRWPVAALTVYGVGASIALLHLMAGWRASRRIAGASLRTSLPFAKIPIRQSRWISTPVTVGVTAPVVLLPVEWASWPDDMLQAVLAHEIAHVRRRDPLVGLLTRVNRCIFWFHPLVWWVERTLAATAEHACDAAAVRAIGGAARYAEILLDMARTVRERGRRLSSQAIGIDGSGLLGRRIDRVLSGAQRGELSLIRIGGVAAGCGAAILTVAACRPEAFVREDADEAVERRDRTLRVQLEEIDRSQHPDVARTDSPGDRPPIETLEAAVAADPENLDTLRALLVEYWLRFSPDPLARVANRSTPVNAVRDEHLIGARRTHILRLIEHHGGSALAGSVEARIFPADLDPFFPGDPQGYAGARQLWLAQAERPDVTSAVLGNAAYFFETADRPLAEEMLLRARALDPEGPWSARLGRFYAIVLVGSRTLASRNWLRTLGAGDHNGPFGGSVRRKLGESKDDVLLTAAGWFLARAPRGPQWEREFDANMWAESCFKRALQVNPHAVLAHSERLSVAKERPGGAEPLWRVPPALQYEYVSALPESERFGQLPDRARHAYEALEDLGRWDDPNLRGRIELARDQAASYAADALKLAPKHRDHPRYGTAIYTANMTLGALALRDGDRASAVGFLRNASRAPASEELAYSKGIVWGRHWHLAGDLLKQGERSTVLDFLERMATINIVDRVELREAAAAIRRGETPRL